MNILVLIFIIGCVHVTSTKALNFVADDEACETENLNNTVSFAGDERPVCVEVLDTSACRPHDLVLSYDLDRFICISLDKRPKEIVNTDECAGSREIVTVTKVTGTVDFLDDIVGREFKVCDFQFDNNGFERNIQSFQLLQTSGEGTSTITLGYTNDEECAFDSSICVDGVVTNPSVGVMSYVGGRTPLRRPSTGLTAVVTTATPGRKRHFSSSSSSDSPVTQTTLTLTNGNAFSVAGLTITILLEGDGKVEFTRSSGGTVVKGKHHHEIIWTLNRINGNDNTATLVLSHIDGKVTGLDATVDVAFACENDDTTCDGRVDGVVVRSTTA